MRHKNNIMLDALQNMDEQFNAELQALEESMKNSIAKEVESEMAIMKQCQKKRAAMALLHVQSECQMRAGAIMGAVKRLIEEVSTAESSMVKREDKEEIKDKAREEALHAQYQ